MKKIIIALLVSSIGITSTTQAYTRKDLEYYRNVSAVAAVAALTARHYDNKNTALGTTLRSLTTPNERKTRLARFLTSFKKDTTKSKFDTFIDWVDKLDVAAYAACSVDEILLIHTILSVALEETISAQSIIVTVGDLLTTPIGIDRTDLVDQLLASNDKTQTVKDNRDRIITTLAPLLSKFVWFYFLKTIFPNKGTEKIRRLLRAAEPILTQLMFTQIGLYLNEELFVPKDPKKFYLDALSAAVSPASIAQLWRSFGTEMLGAVIANGIHHEEEHEEEKAEA